MQQIFLFHTARHKSNGAGGCSFPLNKSLFRYAKQFVKNEYLVTQCPDFVLNATVAGPDTKLVDDAIT